MGVHSTLFGPVKYAILPQTLATEELVGGNGLVEMGTFVAILLGTIAGGLVVAIHPNGPVIAGVVAIAVAVAGYLVSRAIPVTPAVAPELAINWNPFTETWKNLRFAQRNRVVWLSMLGISWFWFYGAIFLAQFAGFSREILGGDEHVVTFLLAAFSVGIGVGSLLCERLSGRRVELGLVPFGSIGLTLFAVDLWLATPRPLRRGARRPRRVPRDARALARDDRPRADRPLRRLLHRAAVRADPGALGAVAPLAHHRRQQHPQRDLHGRVGRPRDRAAEGRAHDPGALSRHGLMNAVVALFIYGLVPEFLMRFLAWMLIHTFYRVDKEGLDHIPEAGPCVVVCNHVSYVDAVVIAGCVRRPIRFVMDHRIFRVPVLSFIFRTMRTIPIASAREDAALKERALR